MQLQVAVVPVGAGNRFGHPRVEVLERLEEAGSQVWRADECGDAEVVRDGERLWVRTGGRAKDGHTPGRLRKPVAGEELMAQATAPGRDRRVTLYTSWAGQAFSLLGSQSVNGYRRVLPGLAPARVGAGMDGVDLMARGMPQQLRREVQRVIEETDAMILAAS